MKRILALLAAMAMLLSIPACAGSVTDPKTDVPTRTVTDDCGRTVEIPASVRTVVPSGPLAQMMLLAIAPELLVGLASDWSDVGTGYISEEILALPCFGQLYSSADLNVEELALAAPQLIVDVGDARKTAASDMDTLQAQTGIPSVHVDFSLQTMPQAFRTLGALLGKEEAGEELAQFCQRVYDRTLQIMEQVGPQKVRTLYVLGPEGHSVLARGSYHAELLDLMTDNLAVVDNPVSKGTGNEVTLEQIALWDADFLLFAPGSIYPSVSELPVWQQMSAVRSGCYAEVPEGPHNWMGNPPSVQCCLGMIWLPSVLYPEYCSYDVQKEVTEYYRLFYSCELTQAQYEALTARAAPIKP